MYKLAEFCLVRGYKNPVLYITGDEVKYSIKDYLPGLPYKCTTPYCDVTLKLRIEKGKKDGKEDHQG